MKRMLAFWLAVCMLMTAAPAALAEEPVAAADSGNTASVDSGIAGGTDALEQLGYTEYRIDVSALLSQGRAKGRAALPTWYGDRLSGETRQYYDLLLQYFQRVHQTGSEKSSLQIDGIFQNLTNEKCYAALHALFADHPELLYWVGKGTGNEIITLINKAKPQSIIILLPVVAEYRGALEPITVPMLKEDGKLENKIYNAWIVVPNRGGKDAQALAKAAELVQTAAGFQTDYEKIRYFNQQICALTDYNYASLNPSAPYDGAFQMFDVFLGKKVVCEGYSKAFKYLCDQSGIPCLLVLGDLSDGQSSGKHMWNFVQLAGKWYLVDVTNNDGAPDITWLLAIGTQSVGMQVLHYSADSIQIRDGVTVPFDVVLSTSAFDPSASSGDSSGTGSGTTGSTGTSGGSGSSGGGGGGGGGGSKGGGGGGSSTVSASVSASAAASQMEKAVNAAVRAALNNNQTSATAQVTVTNTKSVSASALKMIADKASKASAGKKVTVKPVLASKTVRNGKTESVLYINPAQATLATDLKLGVTLSDKVAQAAFQKAYASKAAAVKLAQKGSFGMQVEVAVLLDLSKMDVKSLVFYRYDQATNQFTQLPQPNYFVDKSGFLHFYLTDGGTILITDGK